MELSNAPLSCVYCPYRNQFQGDCSHPLNQMIIRELAHGATTCPVFDDVRANQMQELEQQYIDTEQ